ncbi:50S ribosomal protein L3 [Candidatus Kaiserbacteria bacterium RIFCSPHIGHO2_01_FULL_46_22]|uniref:Large ribosomal subunit protein uL3 n=1 Tax=Candidatus Kaiserbacteria bacterium RIFCSPHIGHO2_01_FULL_46_22 TaxID=1798475 RepID=A0A1F6BX60_9BACT|nr:MAG: 50S ribosomal protein L3 [Candidatus Kaiserbacteria bacterium RIFCSPHIGHO2_01_FULL_46_22]
MKFILGTKDRMTQVFDEKGKCFPVTVLRIEPLTVTAIKVTEKDGYDAVQVAAGTQKENRLSKAELGHQGGAVRYVKEFRARASQGENLDGLELGQKIEASTFGAGDTVTVAAISKGKGFQGVVKRHGFAGDMASHGRKHSARAPGSIGGGGRDGGRVIKGMRMGGRMGGDRITVKNLTIVQVNNDENIILVKGAIPGRKGTLVEVRGISA